MKGLVYIILLLGITLPQEGIPKVFEKKIDRLLKGNFGKEPLELTTTLFPSTTSAIPDRFLFTINRLQEQLGFLVINKSQGCHIGGCDGIALDENAKYENFWYAVVFDNNHQILQIKVLEYTSEYGYEICAKNWLKQFQGYKGCNLTYGSKEVDAISGATVSAQSIVMDISNLCWLLTENK